MFSSLSMVSFLVVLFFFNPLVSRLGKVICWGLLCPSVVARPICESNRAAACATRGLFKRHGGITPSKKEMRCEESFA